MAGTPRIHASTYLPMIAPVIEIEVDSVRAGWRAHSRTTQAARVGPHREQKAAPAAQVCGRRRAAIFRTLSPAVGDECATRSAVAEVAAVEHARRIVGDGVGIDPRDG